MKLEFLHMESSSCLYCSYRLLRNSVVVIFSCPSSFLVLLCLINRILDSLLFSDDTENTPPRYNRNPIPVILRIVQFFFPSKIYSILVFLLSIFCQIFNMDMQCNIFYSLSFLFCCAFLSKLSLY